MVFRIARKFGLIAAHAPCFRVRACLAATIMCLALFAAAPAQAKLRLCNETSYVLSIATAFQLGLASKTEGWQSVLPGSCKTALKNIPDGAGALCTLSRTRRTAPTNWCLTAASGFALVRANAALQLKVGASAASEDMSRPISHRLTWMRPPDSHLHRR